MIYVTIQYNFTLHKKKPMIMNTTNCKKFKGEIENYLSNGLHNFESKINGAFSALELGSDHAERLIIGDLCQK